MASEDDASNMVCPYCLKDIDSLEKMYEHKTKDHGLLAVYQCIQSECRCTFDSVSDYEKHSIIHDQKSFICNVCNYHTTNKSNLLMHKCSSHRALPGNTESRFYCQVSHTAHCPPTPSNASTVR